MKSFNQNLYICHTCHKYLYENEILCQAVYNETTLDTTPHELKDLKILVKILISKRILFKKIAIMNRKGEVLKNKGRICKISIDSANICNVLPRSAVFSGLTFELKRDLKYRANVYFKPVLPHIMYQALAYFKSHSKFYEDISIAKGLSRKEMFRFCDTVEIEGEKESVTEKIISDRTEMC